VKRLAFTTENQNDGAESISTAPEKAAPQPVLNLTDTVALIVGIVVGAGIFRTPSLVAANAGSETAFMAAWALGGAVSLVGALCYAELATAFPNTGGDYHFLTRAFGKKLSFLFAWARMSVIQTGSVALLAFIFGDYMSQLFPLGEFSAAIYAALAIVALTAINIVGIGFGTGTQKLLTVVEVAGVLAIIVAGFVFAPDVAETTATNAPATNSAFGLTMVFVLLTYGGWNEAAYLSAELRDGKRGKKRMAEVKGSDVLYDLGSGDGRIPITAAQRFGTRGVGIDINPERIKEANENAQKAKVTDKVKFIEGDLFEQDFSEATVVTLYLLPQVNLQLKPKILAMKPGTRVVSHNYDMGDWKPEQTKTIQTPDGTDHYIYFWRVPAKK
jgi:hypothetical protein